MFEQNPITQLLGIEYPIIQAGMVWCSGWQLAAAVSNAGGLGLIGSGSMHPDTLRLHIQRCKGATDKPFGVNLPLIYAHVAAHLAIIVDEQVPIVFSSAGSPSRYTATLQSAGCKVVHVVSSAAFAQKAEQAGVDAVVCEGFEAGGHNGREETTTLCLIPLVRRAVRLPVIAAGGIGTGQAMLAAMVLGADGVQVGSRFVASTESSAHPDFKAAVIGAVEGDTDLLLKQLTPVRMLKNPLYQELKQQENTGASPEVLKAALGQGRSRKGMFEGDLVNGELEIGQVSAQIKELLPAGDIIAALVADYQAAKLAVSQANERF
jgi:enoyl-[acyl-carrier protein] reductase II